MEKNYIGYEGETHFYIDLVNKEYGVKINQKDLSKSDEIIAYFKKDREKQIKAWQELWEQEDFEKNQVCV